MIINVSCSAVGSTVCRVIEPMIPGSSPGMSDFVRSVKTNCSHQLGERLSFDPYVLGSNPFRRKS